MKNNKRAFSFVELIVVVAIMAVLSVAAIISYGPAQKKSRDSRRMADLEKIRMALEMARQLGVTYPPNLNVLPTMGVIESIPQNPKGIGYSYGRSPTNNYKYGLGTSMEDAGSTNCPTACGANYNYRITNP